ncbi:metallophosphoesterase [Phocaeicola coprophilus]|nr:metallophosphoesterase [Phocaeicola coprophilus]
MIEYHPYDLDIDGETEVNARNIQRIETALDGKKEFSFAVISDTQRWYDETEDAVADMNEKGGIDFVVHTGDLSDFGMKLEFEKQRDILNGLSVPYVCLLGNHDCLATGKEVFNRIFGEENFSFTAGDVLFICLNTNALEFDYSDAIPDFSFLEKLLKNLSPDIRRTIVAMHAGPYSEQFNNNVAKVFQLYLRQFPGLQFCVYGHGHSIQVNDFFDDGILYYECTCAKKRAYLRFTLKENEYLYEVVNY